MSPGSKHIIQTQSIEVSFHDLDDAFGVQNHIADIFYERLRPEIGLLFDEMFGEKYSVSVERLEIDCGILPGKNWEDEWVEETLRKLKQQLISLDKKENQPAQFKDHFFFFLKHGWLPWNAGIDSIAKLEQLISFDQSFIVKLKELICDSEIVAERLAHQFSREFREKLVHAITNGQEDILKVIYSFAESEDPVYLHKRMIHAAFFKAFSKDNEGNMRQSPSDIFLKKIEEELAGSVKKQFSKPGTTDKPINKEPETGAIYIVNAGLVIVHPFLPGLFERFQLIKEGQWVDEHSQHMAALILEFLNTGADEFPEFNFPLNKILCGIDMEGTLKTAVLLSEEIKMECEIMLTDIIQHWSVLKNTGFNSLRETFLQRNGKLSKVDNGWLLQVEQKGVDVLMSKLPWGIRTIKLPWMGEILYTEW